MSPLATWILLLTSCAVAWSLVALWARWQRRHPQTDAEKLWAEDWWFLYGHHFEDDEGEAADGTDAA